MKGRSSYFRKFESDSTVLPKFLVADELNRKAKSEQ
jgi:hypothetical protein